MSNSLRKRFFDALRFTVGNVIIISIIGKLFLHREYSLSFLIIWTISWAVGRFISQSIATLEKGILFTIITEVMISVSVFIIGAFIMGVLVDIAQWKDILKITLVPFVLGLFITNIYT